MKEGDEVDLIIGVETPLGYNVLINFENEGLLYRNEIFSKISEGQKIKGYIKKIREDGKIDVSLTPQGFKNNIDEFKRTVLAALASNDGVLYYTDKSTPEDIKIGLQMSKKSFKKAIGILYKERKIKILTDKIEIIKKAQD